MKRNLSSPALFAMVIVAFLFGLAPVFHAVCVSAMGDSSAQMTHVMADGTVMDMSAEVAPMVMNLDMSVSASTHATVEPNDSHVANTLGSIMITAGLTLLTFLGLRYCKQALARGLLVDIPQPFRHLTSERGHARARPPTQVDLTTLCISRT
jgi:hypothetical protein